MGQPREISPVRCWIRHVRRTAVGETGTTIAGGVFIREPREAIAGAQGWQSGRVTAALSDTGELSIVLPNTVGEDGKRHARRFACLTQDAYRPGEEWLEVYREPADLLAVCTPYKWTKGRASIELVGYDVAGLLNRFRGSELDVWDGHAPRDVFEHYSRLPGLLLGTDFTGFAVGGPFGIWGLTSVSVSPASGGPRLAYNPSFATPSLDIAFSSMPAGQPATHDLEASDCWTAECRGRIVRIADAVNGNVIVRQGGIAATVLFDGRVRVDGTATAANRGSGPPGPDAYGKLRASPTGALSIRIIVRYDRCWLLINGEVVVEWRRIAPAAFDLATAGGVTISATGGTFDVDSYQIEVLRPFALRGADKGSRRLPGIPPAGGLRARYYNAAGAQATFTTFPARVSRVLDLSSDPDVDRLEATLRLLKGDVVPSMAGAYLARWTGSIYLDLAASDRQLRLGEQGGYARMFVGKTIRNRDEILNRWPGNAGFTDATVTNLLRASSAAFETDTAGWATVGLALNVGATLTRITDDKVIHGTTTGKVVTTAASNLQGVSVLADPALITTYGIGGQFSAIVYLRGAVGGETVSIVFGGAGDQSLSTVTLPGPNADPIAYQVTWTPTASRSATDGNWGLVIRTLAAQALTFYVDDVRITDNSGGGSGAQSNSLRASLGSEAGWYPIVVEAYVTTNIGGFILEDRNFADSSATAWQLVPVSRLSPIGVYEDQLRNESHRSVLDAIAETFGYQWRTEPRSLETGEFPGQLIPRVRIGRDTDKVLDDTGGVDVAVDGTADETIDSLIADAAGIADPTGSGQLAAQVIDYANALAHIGMHTDYQSLAEMSEPTGLETRLGSLLALGSSPAEQVGVRPIDGSTELVDTWPLTGALARMRWQPGDGLRLNLEDVDVIDRTPRQLTRVELGIAPDAIAPPIVGFRQRPRSPAAVLRRTLRAVYAMSRNYQGTMTLIPGSVGSATGNGGAPSAIVSGSADVYSRLPLPVNIADIDRVWLHITYITAATTAVIQINGITTAVTVAGIGLYDVTPYVARAVGTQLRCFAALINAPVGAIAEYILLGRYRI